MFLVLLSKSSFPHILLMLMGIKITTYAMYIMKETSSAQYLQWLLSAVAENR